MFWFHRFDLKNKFDVVEFVVEAFKGDFKPEVEAKFAKAMTKKHAKISKKRAKTIKELGREIESW